jgi:hypothetical protein
MTIGLHHGETIGFESLRRPRLSFVMKYHDGCTLPFGGYRPVRWQAPTRPFIKNIVNPTNVIKTDSEGDVSGGGAWTGRTQS